MPQPWEMEFEAPSDTLTEALPWTQEFETSPSLFDRIKQGAFAGGEAGAEGALEQQQRIGGFVTAPVAHSVTKGETPAAIDTIKAAILSAAPGTTKSFTERLGEMPVRPPTTAEQVLTGVQNVAAEQLTSPLALAFPAAGRVLPPAAAKSLGALFGLQAGLAVPEAARRAGEASVTGDPFEKTVAYGNLGAALTLPPLAALDVASGRAKPKPEREVKETTTQPSSFTLENRINAIDSQLRKFESEFGPREVFDEKTKRLIPNPDTIRPKREDQLLELRDQLIKEQNAIQRETETAVRPVRESPGEGVSEVPIEKPSAEDVARGEPQATEEKLPEVQRDVTKVADDVAKMSPDEFREWASKQPDMRATTYGLGRDAPSQEFVDSLKAKADELEAKGVEAMRSGEHPDTVAALSSQYQFFKEAWQYATGQGSGGEAAIKAGDIPKFSHLLTGELPLAAYKGEVKPEEVPIKVRDRRGNVYEAYLGGNPEAEFPRVGKVKVGSEKGLSHGAFSKAKGDEIIEGPKTEAEYRQAVQQKAAKASQAVSGAASVAETERAPAYSLGIAAPGTAQAQQLIHAFTTAVKQGPSWARDVWNSFSLKSAPKMTESKRELGESAVRFAASPLVGRTKGQIFADRVLQTVDSNKFGTALTEDNLRGIKDTAEKRANSFDTKAREAEEQGDVKTAEENLALRDQALDFAKKVTSLIGKRGSLFKTEAEYQEFLNDPATKEAIERHKQAWTEQKDPLYRQANDLDPDLPLESRGLQTGARINLKALREGETGVKPVGREGFKQLATLRRLDPFARTATGAGQAYEGNYHEIMANGFERELPVAAQHNFIKELINNGDAVVKDKSFMQDLKLKGEETKGYLLTLKPWTGKFLHVRTGLVPEYEGISNLRQPIKVPILSAANNFLTRQSIAGLAEGTTHSSNLMTTVFTAPGPTVNPMLNAVIKSLGRVDLLYSIPKIIIKGFSNQRERMLELTEIGAAKEPYTGAISKRLLNPIDQGVRIVLDDIYKGLADKGIVEKSETARREFINQTGQYNKRLQPNLTRILRETLNPFQTATQTFVAQGLRRMALGPGVKATNNARALSLKADVAAGWMGAIALIAVLNKVTSGKVAGPAGTPLGAVGWVDDKGKVRSFNVLRLLGYERGLRATGVGPAIEARMRGLSGQQAALAGGQSVVSTGLGMVMGPGARFATIAGTGLRPTQPWVKEAKTVPPSDSFNPIKTQMAENIKTAVVEANPIISTAAEIRKGVKEGQRPTDIALKVAEKQASRYAPRTGMSERMAKALPKIVDSRQLRDYTEDVAKDARKLPLNQRYRYVRTRFNEDGLGIKYRDNAWRQIEERGTLKYK